MEIMYIFQLIKDSLPATDVGFIPRSHEPINSSHLNEVLGPALSQHAPAPEAVGVAPVLRHLWSSRAVSGIYNHLETGVSREAVKPPANSS